MANIVRRSEGGMVPGTTNVVDPFQVMREMLSLDPLRQIFGGGLLQRMPLQQFMPQFEVRETDDAYIFKADLPGVNDEDLEITIERNRLTVSGQREMEQRDEKDRYYAVERAYGAFTRTFTLPGYIDDSRVEAEMRDGVLTLKIPKSKEQQAKKVQVKQQQQGGGGGKTAKATSA
ncbi:MAG: heat shock protein, family [bacterium]|nr:heat shock protein, family [bacterium]